MKKESVSKSKNEKNDGARKKIESIGKKKGSGERWRNSQTSKTIIITYQECKYPYTKIRYRWLYYSMLFFLFFQMLNNYLQMSVTSPDMTKDKTISEC